MNSLVALFNHAVERWPKRIALLAPDQDGVTYEHLGERTARWTSVLQSRGVAPGDHVALLARNSFESVAAYFGILKCGAAVVPIDYSVDSSAASQVIHDCKACLLVADTALGKRIPDVVDVERVYLETGTKDVAADAAGPAVSIQPTDLASIVYTSGSEGRSLGVMLSHENLTSNSLGTAEYMRLTSEDRVLCVLPFHYIYGLSLLLSHFAVGGAVVLDNRFLYPQVVAEYLATSEVTGFAGVSSHYTLLIQRTDFLNTKLPQLRYFQHAGDKMPVAVSQQLLTAFPDKELYLMYGQTEASPRLSYLHPSKTLTKPGSVGQAVPGVRLRIVRDDGTDCAAGEEGNLIATGPNIMLGYWKHPAETAETLKDGWLHTGDLAYVDEEGDFFITGRKKQFIKVGGQKVSPAEVERASLEHPEVHEAAAVGVPDDVLGHRVKLTVAAGEVGQDELMSFLKKRLASHMLPAEITLAEQLPKKANGKVDKQKLA